MNELGKKILARVFGPKRGKNRDNRKLHNEEFHSFHRSPNLVDIFKYRRWWTRHLARMTILL